MLGNMLAAKSDLCGQRFEVTISDVVFVGYPMMLHRHGNTQPSPKRDITMISFNVVFALRVRFYIVKVPNLLKYLTLSCPGMEGAIVKIGHSNLWPESKAL